MPLSIGREQHCSRRASGRETGTRTDGIITQLKSGTVLLRYKETDTTQAGQVASITIPEHQSNTDGDGDGGKSEGLV